MIEAELSAERVTKYLNRLRKSRQHDQEFIHSFDVGEPSEAVLLASDLRIMCAAIMLSARSQEGKA